MNQSKILILYDLIIELNLISEVKLDKIGEYILEPNGKGYILKQRINGETYKTISNYKHNSLREMTRFVREKLKEFNKTLT